MFSCFCNQQVQLALPELKKHIRVCQVYQKESPFFREFTKLPLENLQVVHLMAIKSEFSNYMEDLDKLLQEKSTSEQSSGIRLIRGNIISCVKCKTKLDSNIDMLKIFYVDQCLHVYCRGCLSKEIQEEYVNNDGVIKCFCGAKLKEKEMEDIIGKKRYDAIVESLIKKQFNIVKCTKCSQEFSFEGGNNNGVKLKDPQTSKPLPQFLVDHFVNNRFTCLNLGCRQEQCKSCQTSPYHLGMTCEQLKFKKTQKRCRYCDNPIQNNDPNKSQSVCNAQECMIKSKMACNKTLACGHECYGFQNEQTCLPCLHQDCQQLMQSDQKGDDYCNICFVEGLNQAPCIQTLCKHIFHYHCMMKTLEIRWHGPRINFNFCFCPLCKQFMQFVPGSKAYQILESSNVLLEDIKKKAIERLKYEGKDKDERLRNPKDNYYQKPLEYSLAIYCYYECFVCKKPYFGGAKDCQGAMENDSKPFDPKELVCGNCCQVEASDQCQTHGNEYIEYKCKFCCNMSVWFCWGSTHFCDECHKRQCNNDWVSKYPREKLPKCPGQEKCPLGVAHKPNGDECALGCTLCRNQKANLQQF